MNRLYGWYSAAGLPRYMWSSQCEVEPGAPLPEFEAIADRYPVFRVDPC